MATSPIFCSNCRGQISPDRWALHESTCARHCWFCEECNTTVLKSEREKHNYTLHYEMPCTMCSAKIVVSKIAAHKELECPKRLVECKYCECNVFYNEFATHFYICGSRTDKCTYCKKYVKLSQLATHVCQPEPEEPEEVEAEEQEPAEPQEEQEEPAEEEQEEQDSEEEEEPQEEQEPQEPVVLPTRAENDITICPFCYCPAPDYMELQMHIIDMHPEKI